jgi:hypothetical protein
MEPIHVHLDLTVLKENLTWIGFLYYEYLNECSSIVSWEAML